MAMNSLFWACPAYCEWCNRNTRIHHHITAIPSDFDRMANGAFHTGARGLVLLCHTRVKLFCHRIDNLRVFDGHDDGIPKIVVSLNVGWHANLMQDLRDLNAQVAAAGAV